MARNLTKIISSKASIPENTMTLLTYIKNTSNAPDEQGKRGMWLTVVGPDNARDFPVIQNDMLYDATKKRELLRYFGVTKPIELVGMSVRAFYELNPEECPWLRGIRKVDD